MKRQHYGIIVLTLLILSGAIYWFYNKQTPNSADLKEVTFQKKKECAALRTQIEARIQKDWPENEFDGHTTLEKIFYSPKMDSCLYTFRIEEYSKDRKTSIQENDLVDAFTNELIAAERGCIPKENCTQSTMTALTSFDMQLEEYR